MQTVQLPEPVFYPLLHIHPDYERELPAGDNCRVVPVNGGTVGGTITGTLAQGGGLWFTDAADKTASDMRFNLKTDDGKLIVISLRGWKDGCRIHGTVGFQTCARKYKYLNSVIAVALTDPQTGAIGVYGMLPGKHPERTPARLPIRRLCAVEVECLPPMIGGRDREGLSMVVPITGGRFAGEALRGSILSVGSDWNTVTLEGGVNIHVRTRYMWKTDAGALISLSTDGRAVIPVKALPAMKPGSSSGPDRYYFRQHLHFSTGDPDLRYLNRAAAFAVVGATLEKGVKIRYDAYMLDV